MGSSSLTRDQTWTRHIGSSKSQSLDQETPSFSLAVCIFIIRGLSASGFPAGSVVKILLTVPETQDAQVPSLRREDPLQEGMATHSSVRAWRSPWTEDPGGLSPRGRKESDTAEHAHMLCSSAVPRCVWTFFVSLPWGSLCLLDLWDWSFHQIQKVGGHYFFKFFVVPLFPLLGNSTSRYVRPLEVVHVMDVLLIS